MKLTLGLVRCLGAEQWRSAYTPAVQMWRHWGILYSLLPPSLTLIWAQLSVSPPHAAGLRIKKRSAELRSMSDAWEAGSRRPLCTPSSSVRLPDHIQGLHHLLIDDENYGHIQTHTTQPWNCPFIETTDGHKEREGWEQHTVIKSLNSEQNFKTLLFSVELEPIGVNNITCKLTKQLSLAVEGDKSLLWN